MNVQEFPEHEAILVELTNDEAGLLHAILNSADILPYKFFDRVPLIHTLVYALPGKEWSDVRERVLYQRYGLGTKVSGELKFNQDDDRDGEE